MLNHTLRHSLRTLRRQRFYFLLNVAGLVIGMLTFLYIMLYVNHERGFDKFHSKSNRIYRLHSSIQDRVTAIVPYVWANSLDGQISAIEKYVTFQRITVGLAVKRGDEVFAQYDIVAADSTFFDIFDFPVLQGDKNRFLHNPGKIVITPKAVEKYFGSTNPIGKNLQINLWGTFVNFEVEGIVECPNNSHLQFDFLLPNQLVKQYFFAPDSYTNWSTHFAYTYLLMAPEFDKEQLKIDFTDYLRNNGGEKVAQKNKPDIFALEDIYLHSDLRYDFQPRGSSEYVSILTLIAYGIVILAIINFANITSALAIGRWKEIGVKKMHGSSRSRIISQLLMESVATACIALLLTFLLAGLLLPVFNQFAGKAFVAGDFLNGRVITQMLMLTIIMATAAGLFPALKVSRLKPRAVLAVRGSGKAVSTFQRKVLVVVQFFMATVLLVATGVMRQQVVFMKNIELGLESSQVVVVENARVVASNPLQTDLFRKELIKMGIASHITASSTYPGLQPWGGRYYPEGITDEKGISMPTIYSDHDLLRTYKIEMVAGRDLSREFSSDSTAFLINEQAAKLLASMQTEWAEPIGRNLSAYGVTGPVIGVFKDFYFYSAKNSLSPLVVNIDPESFFYLQVRLTDAANPTTLARIESLWKELFPEVPFDYSFVDDEFDNHLVADQGLSRLLLLFSALAVFVAALGLVGLASFLAHEKSKELSLRKVVGATEQQLLLMLLWLFLKLVLLASAIALPLAYYLMDEWLNTFANRMAMPVGAYLLTLGLTLLVTFATVSYQSLLSARANPAMVLSKE